MIETTTTHSGRILEKKRDFQCWILFNLCSQYRIILSELVMISGSSSQMISSFLGSSVESISFPRSHETKLTQFKYICILHKKMGPISIIRVNRLFIWYMDSRMIIS